jgi:hypothetical protein
LLRLDYNGAVDPTSYLEGWRRLAAPKTPSPVHPPFPAGAVRSEARYIWRELLAARGLTPEAPKPSERPHIAVPDGDLGSSLRRLTAAKRREAAEPSVRATRANGVAVPVLLAGIMLPAVLFAGALVYRVRRNRVTRL